MPYSPIRYPTKKIKHYVPRNKKHELTIQQRVAAYLRSLHDRPDFHSDYAAGMLLSYNQSKIRRSLESGRGWPDMFVAVPRRGKMGLFMELKKENTSIYVTRGPRKGELVADEQIIIEAAVLERLNKLGYMARFVIGFDNAKKLINWYFGIENEPENETLF